MSDEMSEADYLEWQSDGGAAEDFYWREVERRCDEKSTMRQIYRRNKEAEVGCTITCPCCGQLIVKRSYQQAFCKKKVVGKSSCKDRFWNLLKPRGIQKGDWRA